jgi:hypothetical protein
MRPLVARPRPEHRECLDGYLIRLAALYRMPILEMADYIGMTRPNEIIRVSSPLLTDIEMQTIASTTRLYPTEVQALTDRSLRLLMEDAESNPGPQSAWFHRGFTPFCPLCMRQCPGVWHQVWRVPAAAVCPVHFCALVAECPSCNEPTFSRRTGTGTRWSAVPKLGVCHNARAPRSRSICGARLEEAFALPASQADVDARNVVGHGLDGGSYFYVGKISSASDVLFDIRMAVNLICAAKQADLDASNPQLAARSYLAIEAASGPPASLVSRPPLVPEAMASLITFAVSLLSPVPI